MKCRSCEGQQVTSIFSLGEMPLANRLLTAEQLQEHEPKYHLEIMLCTDCSMVQLKDIVSPAELFTEYFYFSSHSDTMIKSASALIDELAPSLSPDAKIIEVASNDGYLLQHYLKKSFAVLGIEPARNIADHANAKGIPTRTAFFTTTLAKALVQEGWSADVIHANNVMAHIPDTNDFAAAIKTLLKPEGRAIIEVPYLLDLIEHCEFDTIYHEHVYYFSLLALEALFARHGLVIANVRKIPIHGGSLRLFVMHAEDHQASQTVMDMLAHERALGIDKPAYYQPFCERIHALKEALLSALQAIKRDNKKVAAYGASAKGATLLNFFGLGKEVIDFVVDRSPVKQGHYTPGTHLKIYPVDTLVHEKMDYALLLTWNFAEEILRQQQAFRDGGGKFIVPIPKVEVV